MPDIMPAIGDPVEITIDGHETPILANIAEKDGYKLTVILSGKPPLKGIINIDNYLWSGSCWKLKPQPRPVLRITNGAMDAKKPSGVNAIMNGPYTTGGAETGDIPP